MELTAIWSQDARLRDGASDELCEHLSATQARRGTN
jgi:hypothetical protein